MKGSQIQVAIYKTSQINKMAALRHDFETIGYLPNGTTYFSKAVLGPRRSFSPQKTYNIYKLKDDGWVCMRWELQRIFQWPNFEYYFFLSSILYLHTCALMELEFQQIVKFLGTSTIHFEISTLYFPIFRDVESEGKKSTFDILTYFKKKSFWSLMKLLFLWGISTN